MKYILAGQVNVDVVSALTQAGVAALGVSGVSASLVRAHRRPPMAVSGGGDGPVDFGLVGDVDSVNTDLLLQLLRLGVVPVVASLGADEAGRVFNINADTVAASVSTQLKAEAMVMVTAVGGVYTDLNRPDSRMARLSKAQAQEAISSDVISGGMIPKVEEGLKALSNGVRAVVIADVGVPNNLCRALDEPGAVGTYLVA
jgi:acetylglutamate kinase